MSDLVQGTTQAPPRPAIIPAQRTHLTDGWEPDLSETDTVVRRAVLAHASWAVSAARSLGRPALSTSRWAGGYVGERGMLTNPVVVTRPLADEEFADVVEEVSRFFPVRAPYFLLSPFPTPDLTPSGLEHIGHPPLMVRFPGGQAPALRQGVEVAEVSDADTLAIAEEVLIEGYPMPELSPAVRRSILDPSLLGGTTRVWLARVDGEPAAVAAAHVAGGATLVEYVAALPPARGRGAGAAATWAATLCEPALPAVLVASDDGRPLYESMGFVAIERWTAWVRPAS